MKHLLSLSIISLLILTSCGENTSTNNWSPIDQKDTPVEQSWNSTQFFDEELGIKWEILIEDSTLKIQWQAIGPWFFEASFFASLYNQNWVSLGDIILTSEWNWMTNDYVDFSWELPFISDTQMGNVTFYNANASGLPENHVEKQVDLQLLP